MNQKLKLATAFACGAIFFSGISYAADSDLLAKIVDYKISVNGSEKKLENKPVLINESTYLPLRELAELIGYEVGWNNGEIALNSKKVAAPKYEVLNMLVYPLKIYINGEYNKETQYLGEYSGDFLKDKDGVIYCRFDKASSLILIAAGETTNNQQFKTIDYSKRDSYYTLTTKYTNDTEKYEEAIFYNKDHTKKYEASGNKDDPRGAKITFGGTAAVIPVNKLMQELGYKLKVTVDDAKQEVVIDVVY